MKKSFLFWMFAMLMLVVGMSSCSSDDDFDFSTIDANELSICSDKGESEIGLAYNPQCYVNGKNISYETDGSIRTSYHLKFSLNIKESPVLYLLQVDIESSKRIFIEDLKIGDTFDSSEVGIFAYYTPTWKEYVMRGARAHSGKMRVISKYTTNEKSFLVVRFSDLKFESIDKTSIYTVNATIVFEVLNYTYAN
jgi:hypothetical protein